MFDWNKMTDRLFGMGGPRVRLMRPDDLDEVLRMIRLHDSDDYKAAKQSFSRSRFDLPQEVTAHFVVIDPQENRPVGVTGYYKDDLEAKDLFWLGWTYVNPFFRGQGYGGILMEFVLEALNEVGARKLFLSTSSLESYAAAVGFYKRYGFVEEGRLLDFYNDGEHQLILGRRLDAPRPKKATYRPKKQPEAPSNDASSFTSPSSSSSSSRRAYPMRGDRQRPRDEPDRKGAGDEDSDVVFEF